MAFDNRLLRVGIEIEGQVNFYEDLAITASGSKFASVTQNETKITIANLNKDVRDFLLTEGTPFNRVRNRRRKRIIVEAGRESYGLVKVFEGDITTTTVSQPPDITLSINALTSQFNKGKIVTPQVPTITDMSKIAQQAAESLGIDFDFQATDKKISNYNYSGSAAGQVGKIQEFGGIDAYVDDDVLVVKNEKEPLPGQHRVLNIDTGLVGIPIFTEFGIKTVFMFDGQSGLGSEIEIQSKIYPASNGLYEIYRLAFDLANRDDPFYYIAESRRIG